jgi:hypothetical protein
MRPSGPPVTHRLSFIRSPLAGASAGAVVRPVYDEPYGEPVLRGGSPTNVVVLSAGRLLNYDTSPPERDQHAREKEGARIAALFVRPMTNCRAAQRVLAAGVSFQHPHKGAKTS